MSAARDRLERVLAEQGSTRIFAVFRVLFIASLLIYTTIEFHGRYLPEPRHRQLLGWVMMVASWTCFVGWWTRLSTWVFALSWGYLFWRWGHVDRVGQAMQDAQVFQGLVILALAPSGASLSLDRWWKVTNARRRGGELPHESGPLWTRWLGLLSLTVMYLFVLRGMLSADWLNGMQVETMWLGRWGSSDSLAGAPELRQYASMAVAWLSLPLVAGLVTMLWLPGWRARAIGLGLGLHLVVWAVVGGWPFTLTTLSFYALLFDPERVDAFFEAQAGRAL